MTQDHDIWQWQEPGKAWKGSGLYHITLKIPTCEPLLGDLVIPDNDPTQAYIKHLPLGDALLLCLREFPNYHPEIQVLHYCLMPDHLHMIWYVRQAMPRSIRMVLSGFRSAAQKLGRAFSYYDEATFSSVAPTVSREKYQENTLRKQLGNDAYYALYPIFTEMPHIRPMGQRRQLPATLRYIDMNPQRLATKRLMPKYFRVQDNIEIAGRIYCGVGNTNLLQAAHHMPVHVRHTMLDEAAHGDDNRLNAYMDSCIAAAEKGAVLVSPFIHKKEREVLYSVLAEGGKAIYLADNGFGEYYKPSDGIFDAVANKQVLILSPWPYDPKKRGITRAECVAMNQMAEEICSLSSIAPTVSREEY
jgi:REP element-mobilizing transposase RayT